MKNLVCTLGLIISLQAAAQNYEDSLHIADLKKKLTNAKGTAKVDILNDLAYEFQSSRKLKDSAARYQQWAYEEAQKIGYKHGIALSLLRIPASPEEKKLNLEKAISIGKETNDHQVLGWAYYGNPGGNGIDNYKKAVDHFRQAKLEQDEAEVSTWLTTMLVYAGRFEEAFPYAERNLKITQLKRKHAAELQHVLVEASYYNVAELYKAAGDIETSISYIQRARNYNIQHTNSWTMNPLLAYLYCKANKPDSAIYYLKNDPQTPIVLVGLAEAYIIKGNHQEAITLIDRSIDSVTLPRPKPFYRNSDPFLMGAYRLKSKAYLGMGNSESALQALLRSDAHATIAPGNIDEQLDKYRLYSDVYQNLGKSDSAYKYLKKYTLLKDSVDNKKALWRLSLKLSQLQAAISAQKKEADLALKEAILNRQIFIRNSLIGGLFSLLLVVFVILRNIQLKRRTEKLELQKELIQSEQKQAELRSEAVELEMQALRAQMNPHFIFNCLSSINSYIFKHDNKTASDYLTKFSRLIRLVLLQSQKKLIPLEDELEMLRLYLDLERMRFQDGFDYSITTNNTIDAGEIMIPPLVLQPFCENAIWHGLMHKEDGRGQLNISIAEEDGTLFCTITDNGIGREKAGLFKSKSAENRKSLGLKITGARLDLANNKSPKGTSFTIEDRTDERGNVIGTTVILRLSIRETIEEKV